MVHAFKWRSNKRIIKQNKRGAALILVVLLFMVMTILTVALLSTANSELFEVVAEENIDQAHYVARAAVQATADWIGTHYNARAEMAKVIPDRTQLGEEYAKTVTSNINNHAYILNVWRDTSDADLVHIMATAEVNGLPATVQMSLQETISGFAIFEDAIYSKGPFGKSSGNANLVTGSVSTGSDSIPSNLNVSGAKTTLKTYMFEDILPPSDVVFPAKIASASLNSSGIVNNTANLNVSYGTLNLSGNVTITNTDAVGNPQDVHILVDDLNLSSSAVIYPSNYNGGNIYIYVINNIVCDKKFGIEGNDAHPCVYLICSGTGDINFSGNPSMNVYLYGPDVNVEYGGSIVFNGAIIANVYGWNGNITINYRKPDLTGTPFSGLDEAQRTVSISDQTWING